MCEVVEADTVAVVEGNIAPHQMVERSGSTGVEEQGTSARVPQEPGRPRHFRESGIARRKRTERGEMSDEESEHPIVPMRSENLLEGIRGREGGASMKNCWRERCRRHRAPLASTRNSNG